MKTVPAATYSPMQDPTIRTRVAELLSQMTLAQKIGQMTQADRLTCTPEDVRKYHLGSVLSAAGSCPVGNRPEDWVKMNDAYWYASTQKDSKHLGIPILYGLDAVHGNNNVRGATIFPHNIGLGAANDADLMSRIARVTAREILATGVDWAFAPNLAVARDYHWGRTYESFSELPDIVSHYASVIVSAFQQDLGSESVLACAKHWVGDGGTAHGIDQGDTSLSFELLEQRHIRPYYDAIRAGVMTIMASFSSWNGEKCHASRYLLSEVLKDKLGFKGFVVSDMQGIDYISEDFYLAVAKGVNAGIDMFMLPENWLEFIDCLQSHVEMGTVPIERINDAVTRILTVKFAFGLFDKPRPAMRPWSNDPKFGSEEHRAIAREAVRKSLVLLKNKENVLPLSRDQRIFVAGKLAHSRGSQCGGFTLEWQGVTDNDSIEGGSSIWEGIQQFSPYATLSEKPLGKDADPKLHDVAIVVIGEEPYAEGMGDIRDGDNVIVEAGSLVNGQLNVLEAFGSSLELAQLYPDDLKTLRNIVKKGIPVVAVLVSGRPLLIENELDLANGFVAAWLPGSEGQGISDVLFGDYDFVGKLSFSWPSKAQPKVNADESDYRPLFPYGYGLTYAKVPARKHRKTAI